MDKFTSTPKVILEMIEKMKTELPQITFSKEQLFPFQIAINNFAKMFDLLADLIQTSDFQRIVHEAKSSFRAKSNTVFTSLEEARDYLGELLKEINLMETEEKQFTDLIDQIQEFERKRLAVTEKKEMFQSFYKEIVRREKEMNQTSFEIVKDISQFEEAESGIELVLTKWNQNYQDVFDFLSKENQKLLQEYKLKENEIAKQLESLQQYQEKFQRLDEKEIEIIPILSLYAEANTKIMNQFGETSANEIRNRLNTIQTDLKQADAFIKEMIELNEQIRKQNQKARTPGV